MIVHACNAYTAKLHYIYTPYMHHTYVSNIRCIHARVHTYMHASMTLHYYYILHDIILDFFLTSTLHCCLALQFHCVTPHGITLHCTTYIHHTYIHTYIHEMHAWQALIALHYICYGITIHYATLYPNHITIPLHHIGIYDIQSQCMSLPLRCNTCIHNINQTKLHNTTLTLHHDTLQSSISIPTFYCITYATYNTFNYFTIHYFTSPDTTWRYNTLTWILHCIA